MIKAIIFDLNGVFIKSPKLSDRFRDELGVPETEFMPVLKEIMTKIRMPNAGDAFTYWKPYLNKWGIKLDREQFLNFWFSAEKEVPEMATLAKNLKVQGLKIFILSNNFIERAAYYHENFPVLRDISDKIYYSWQTGFVKPSKEAYLRVLIENNLKPEECLCFDDVRANIETAENLGIKAYLFEDTESVRSAIFSLNQ